jgi:hypothetical protein
MSRNLPTLQEIAGDPRRLSEISLDGLDALLIECEQTTKTAAAAKKAIVASLEGRYAGQITAAYQALEKDFGAVRVSDGAYEVVVDRPKRVEWDQAKLLEIRDRIQFSGDNPSEFIKTELSVDERKFTAWPANIRSTFEPARTLKPGSVSIKLARKEAA